MSTLNAGKRIPLFALFLIFLFASSLAMAEDDPGFLGVMLQDLKPSMAKALQLDDKSGVLISEIVENSPAEKAGLEDGDVVLIFNGQKTENSKILIKAVRKAAPGENVKVVVLRDGKEKTIKVEMGEREDDTTVWHVKKLEKLHEHKGMEKQHKMKVFKWNDDEDDCHVEILGGDHLQDIYLEGNVGFFGGDRGVLGIHIDDLGEQMGEYFGVKNGDGVLVTEVVEDGPAEKSGLKAGDVIVKIDGESVASTGELHKAMAGTEAEQEMKVEVVRKGDKKKFEVTLGEATDKDFLKQIEIIEGKHRTIRSPRMKMHMIPQFEHKEDFHGEGLDELRQELKNLKKELKEIQKELKK